MLKRAICDKNSVVDCKWKTAAMMTRRLVGRRRRRKSQPCQARQQCAVKGSDEKIDFLSPASIAFFGSLSWEIQSISVSMPITDNHSSSSSSSTHGGCIQLSALLLAFSILFPISHSTKTIHHSKKERNEFAVRNENHFPLTAASRLEIDRVYAFKRNIHARFLRIPFSGRRFPRSLREGKFIVCRWL